LKINIKAQQDLKDVYADMDRIEQVLTNLITNAIKFSPENGVISISAKMISADDIFVDECFSSLVKELSGDYVQVCVSDQGMGIPKDDLDRVFDKFVQIETTLSREVGGSGLGLSIAKEIISAHKGMIWCSSELNKGANFYFVLPVAK
jgi:two-component system sensor histidine kinase VicK